MAPAASSWYMAAMASNVSRKKMKGFNREEMNLQDIVRLSNAILVAILH